MTLIITTQFLSAVLLSVFTYCYTECRYSECCYAEGHYYDDCRRAGPKALPMLALLMVLLVMLTLLM
jgi:hypothetical protein